MSIDMLIATCALGSFFLFLVMHAVAFRFIRPFAALAVLFRSYMATGMVGALGVGIWLYHTTPCMRALWGAPILWGVVVYMILYTLLAMVYIVGVFSIIESSITLRLLCEIGASDARGMTQGDIEKKYPPSAIIKRRLDRFIYMGELRYAKGLYYTRRTSVTFFSLRERIVAFIAFLFPRIHT